MPRGRRGTAKRKVKVDDNAANESNSAEQEDANISITENTEDVSTAPVDSQTATLSNGAQAAPDSSLLSPKNSPFPMTDDAPPSQPHASTSAAHPPPSSPSLKSILNSTPNMNGSGSNPFPPPSDPPFASTSQQTPFPQYHTEEDLQRWRDAEIDKRQAEVSSTNSFAFYLRIENLFR